MKIYEEEKASMHINYIVNLGNMLFTNNYILEVEKLQKKKMNKISNWIISWQEIRFFLIKLASWNLKMAN